MAYYYVNILEALRAQEFGVKLEIPLGVREYAMAKQLPGLVKYYITKESEELLVPIRGDIVEYKYSSAICFGEFRGIDNDAWLSVFSWPGYHHIKPENLIGILKRKGMYFPSPTKEYLNG